MEKNKVTVVIPNYNGKRFLKKCLESLEKQTYTHFETLIIDNASSDGSAEYIKANYPWAEVVVMRRNLGFAGGVNEGIRLCRTPYVLLLNNDTESDPEMIRELVRAMESSEEIFSVSCRMIQYHNRKLLDDAGDLYTLLGWAVQRGVGQSLSNYKKQDAVFSACAGAAIYRKYILDRIGYFDETHFAYLED
ncbi:MAG: glycosyltransferase family 2 protein, partial [Parasporobacterium sp.]|nr:glycosyltransferase family 2 protein [Parasporobacterium sp.]